jgi:Transcription elongation factor, GreA/GreB, C-term
VTALPSIDKAHVLAELRARLERDLAVAVEAQRRTQSGATHEESRPENDKDTRALESSYLARGQAQRVVELSQALTSVTLLELRRFEPSSVISVSALVGLDDGERTVFYFMAPMGGGLELDVDGHAVRVLTPQSPVGRALVGQRLGSDIEVRTPQGLREYSVVALT